MLSLLSRLIVTRGYIANYGYTDGSGDYYISVDSERCNGCGDCVPACPQNCFEVLPDDYDDLVARIRDEVARDLKYLCMVCKPVSAQRNVRCQRACPTDAISHSW